MASFRKRGDKWQARVHRKDHSPVVQSFNTKADAVKWARHTESQLDLGTLAPKAAMPPLMRIVDRYLAEVTPTKKGSKQELNRGRQIARTSLGSMQLDKITSEAVSKYRDGRLGEVSNNTVRLELAFISVVFEQCAKEWSYKVVNPFEDGQNLESKSPTPIGWVDYLDIWAKSKTSKKCHLDLLDFSSNYLNV